MQKVFLLGLLVLLPLVVFYTQPTSAEAPIIPEQPKPPTVEDLVVKFSTQYQIDGQLLSKVIKCESNFNINAINYNDGGAGKHSVGILQFQELTFQSWSKILGEELDYHSYMDQIKLASFMWSKNQQKQWSCFKIVNGI